jgi:arylformamidase
MTGPAVWLDLTQDELDAAYDQIKYAPNQPQIVKRYASNSEAFRLRFATQQRFSYGDAAIEELDVYSTGVVGAPINIFIHGGAWRSGLAKDYGFLAELSINAGVNFVVPDFSWVQDVAGNLEPIALQVRRAVAWVYRHAQKFGGDPGRIHITGHSSGAHLAAVLLATNWQKDFGLPAETLKSGLCCSGIYELKPVRLSSRSSYVTLTEAIEESLSPQRQVTHIVAPLIVAYGSLETPEFQRQARDFAAALQAAGKKVELVSAEGYNHFEVLETLANPYGVLGRVWLAHMQKT